MKKTSLMLALGALLYGTSGTYVLADIHPGMTNAEIEAVLAENCNDPNIDIDVPSALDVAEDADIALPAATQPPPPSNIWVDDSSKRHMGHFCGFSPTGANMADFPVSVSLNDITVDTATFEPLGMDSGIAIGNGWLLYQSGDTWSQKWCLVTERPIDDLELNPMARPGKPKYAFDIIFWPTHSDELDTGSQKGFAVAGKTAKFKATYSLPVLVGDHTNDLAPGGIPYENLLDRWNRVGEANTHDMYGKLKIEFDKPLEGAVDLGEHFIFRADTDCLPVREAKLDSYDANSGIVNLTLLGSGLSYIQESCPGEQPSAIPGATFDVQGRSLVSAVVMPISGCCYSLVDVDTGQNVRLLGVDGAGNGTDEICAP
jgi:hypothetical protein